MFPFRTKGKASFISALVAGAMAAGGSAQAQVYNPASQFSSTQNPSGPWGYYFSNTMLMTQTQLNVNGIIGLDNWWDGQGPPDASYVTRNATGADLWLNKGSFSAILYSGVTREFEIPSGR